MALVNLNIVLIGESFPVGSIDLADFQFRHKKLRETARLPVLLQAETDSVRLVVIPERFEAAITRPDRIAVQLEGLTALVDGFFEYVGRKAILGVGHNFTYIVENSAHRSRDVLSQLADVSKLSGILHSEGPMTVTQKITFNRGSANSCQLTFGPAESGDIGLDYNFHYDLRDRSDGLSASEAVRLVSASYELAQEITESFGTSTRLVAK